MTARSNESGLHPGVSLVVPVYNSEDCLPKLVDRLGAVAPNLTERFELILVNDASRDGSWEAIRRLARSHGWVRGINLARNFGQHAAVLCGIRAARFDTIVTLDDDLQHPPEEIPKLLAALTAGQDVVYGTPRTGRHGFWRNVASLLTKIALRSAMGVEAARRVSAFRAFRTRLREAFASTRGPYVSVDVLLTWSTTRFTSVQVRHDDRRIGKSNYTFSKLVTHALNMLTGYSTTPLQAASLVGFFMTVFGVLVLAFVVGRYLLEGCVMPGFAFLASIVAIFSGAQLFTLGVIGEYLTRMHQNLMDRPAYVVREEIRSFEEPGAGGPRTDRSAEGGHG